MATLRSLLPKPPTLRSMFPPLPALPQPQLLARTLQGPRGRLQGAWGSLTAKLGGKTR